MKILWWKSFYGPTNEEKKNKQTKTNILSIAYCFLCFVSFSFFKIWTISTKYVSCIYSPSIMCDKTPICWHFILSDISFFYGLRFWILEEKDTIFFTLKPKDRKVFSPKKNGKIIKFCLFLVIWQNKRAHYIFSFNCVLNLPNKLNENGQNKARQLSKVTVQ